MGTLTRSALTRGRAAHASNPHPTHTATHERSRNTRPTIHNQLRQQQTHYHNDRQITNDRKTTQGKGRVGDANRESTEREAAQDEGSPPTQCARRSVARRTAKFLVGLRVVLLFFLVTEASSVVKERMGSLTGSALIRGRAAHASNPQKKTNSRRPEGEQRRTREAGFRRQAPKAKHSSTKSVLTSKNTTVDGESTHDEQTRKHMRKERVNRGPRHRNRSRRWRCNRPRNRRCRHWRYAGSTGRPRRDGSERIANTRPTSSAPSPG